MNRTPFIQQATGDWILLLPAGMSLEWGHSFDKDIGYRVFMKFKESKTMNLMPATTARIWAAHFSKNENRPDILNVCAALRDMSKQVDALNQAWAAAGAPDSPLEIQNERNTGHA